jgi:RNA polymerase sigma-70 factor (ECF subfamily)
MNLNNLENLIVLFNKGDKNAFETIYIKLFPSVYKHSRQFVKTHEEAEDIASDTFLKLLSMRGRFHSMKKLISFLYVTSKNAGIDRRRQFKMQSGKRTDLQQTIQMEQIHIEINDNVTEHLLNRLYQEIEKLPGKSREVFKLAYIQELKNAEIALYLGTDEKTVRNQKASAIKRLRMMVFSKFRF